jgi:hypothetical protein
LFASLDSKAFDKPALLYGEGADNITIEGRGTEDGQAEYVYLPSDFDDPASATTFPRAIPPRH